MSGQAAQQPSGEVTDFPRSPASVPATMPAQVAAAVVSVMKGVKALEKKDRNQHGGYEFASVDAFLAAVNPLCAEAGLIVLQDEVETEVVPSGNKLPWLKVKYAFTLATSAGVTFGPLHRSVMVQATGPQAFGAAQSYVLKTFMRQIFLIATGDKDELDHYAPVALPQAQQGPQQRVAQHPPQSAPPPQGHQGHQPQGHQPPPPPPQQGPDLNALAQQVSPQDHAGIEQMIEQVRKNPNTAAGVRQVFQTRLSGPALDFALGYLNVVLGQQQ